MKNSNFVEALNSMFEENKKRLISDLDILVMGGIKKINMNEVNNYFISKNKNGYTYTVSFFNDDVSIGTVEVKTSNVYIVKEILKALYV